MKLREYQQHQLQLHPPQRRHQLPEGECTYCDRERDNHCTFHPSHDPSPLCMSGSHNHCSCDICF